MTDQPYDEQDFDPDHPDLQHEQPPVEATDDEEDSEPGEGEAGDVELPGEIPDVSE